MANLTAADVSVDIKFHGLTAAVGGDQDVIAELQFGDSALLYVAGGVPIDKGKLGCASVIKALQIFDKGSSTYDYSYDTANEKIMIRKILGADLVEITGDAPAAQTIRVRAIGW